MIKNQFIFQIITFHFSQNQEPRKDLPPSRGNDRSLNDDALKQLPDKAYSEKGERSLPQVSTKDFLI